MHKDLFPTIQINLFLTAAKLEITKYPSTGEWINILCNVIHGLPVKMKELMIVMIHIMKTK